MAILIAIIGVEEVFQCLISMNLKKGSNSFFFTCLLRNWIPAFSIAFANSSLSTPPELSRSKNLKFFNRMVSSVNRAVAFCASFCFNSFSNLEISVYKMIWGIKK